MICSELLLSNCVLQMRSSILFGFRLVAFNLGYLPGGDKTILTSPRTTVAALHAACRVLQSGGLISVMVYIGHPGGRLVLRFFPFSATCLVFLAALFWVFVEGPLWYFLFSYFNFQLLHRIPMSNLLCFMD